MTILENDILRNIVVFSGKSLIYTGLITIIGWVISWVLYRYVVVRLNSIKKALFEDDNFAAWVEFIGAFVLPVFYLSALAISVERGTNFLSDMLYGALYAVALTLIFTLLRIIAGWGVHFICKNDESGKISLYKEVYEQKNIAAALFSVSLALVFVNMISNITFENSTLILSLCHALEILVLTLVFHLIYGMLQIKISMLNEIFSDNNTAAGLVFLGFTFAIQIILNTVVNYRTDILDIDIAILSCIGFVILLLIVFANKFLYTRVLKVKLFDELYKDNNSGAALGEISLLIGTALIISHFIK